MQLELKNRITSLLKESRQFNANDVLVHVDIERSGLFRDENCQLNFSIDEFPFRIIRETQQTIKETGVNALCLTLGCIQLEVSNKKVHSPFLLVPLEIKKDRIKKRLSFERDFDEAFINPFVIDFLNSHKISTDIKEFLVNDEFDRDKFHEFVASWGLSVVEENDYYIGNFHHHRYQVIKELEEILKQDNCSDQLSSLFGFVRRNDPNVIDLSDSKLFSADTDHYKVFDQAKHSDLVIQGPPGTGKSQVLTNLGAKLLATGCTTIYVSEKRSALEVIKKKLAEFDLDKFCFIATANYNSHLFLWDLKESWNNLESTEVNSSKNLRLSEQYADNLQMTLDLLNQPSLIGGVSYHEFKSGMNGTPVLSHKYSSAVMEISSFGSRKELIKSIYSNELSYALGHFREVVLRSDDFKDLDKQLKKAREEISLLNEEFDTVTWSDLSDLMRRSTKCQVFENEMFKKYAGIFRPNSKQNKSFLALYKKWIKARKECELDVNNHSEWKTIPSEAEANSLLNDLENGGFLNKLRVKKRWRSISHIPLRQGIISLKRLLEQYARKNQFAQLSIKFCDLGIENPEIDVPLIRQLLDSNQAADWKEIMEYTVEEREKYTMIHRKLNELYSDLRSTFHIRDNENIKELVSTVCDKFGELVALHHEIVLLTDLELRALGRNNTFESFKDEMYSSHWIRFQERFPNYAKFDVKELHSKVKHVLEAEKREARLFANEIIAKAQKRFQYYHELLSTPARKLNEDQKALKVQLRKGKAILVKEFGKSRSHPSLRELFNSEARVWIQLLKPIWLSNPSQLANCFPMEKGLFDVAIFDEASQIPLQNALGAMQRCKRAIIAGDENQMGPTSYFKKGTNDVIDLLHQASYYWNSVPLKHHYRSVHPDLIAFSNKHFYKGELAAYPAKNDGVALQHYYVEDGIYEERKNEEEAKTLASLLSEKLKTNKQIGVVAFSKEQLGCIWNKLSVEDRELFQEKLDKDQAFFKALENVQGDECDQLLISFGYGRNSLGEFHMRFGPMNRSNGRKRLNVLLTRARENIHFFCSVKSSDFKLSENESINLLRLWFQHLENYNNDSSYTFPFGVTPKIEGDSLIFSQVQKSFPVARELVTLQSVLEDRGWNVHYE